MHSGEGLIFWNENFGFGLMSKIRLRSYSVLSPQVYLWLFRNCKAIQCRKFLWTNQQKSVVAWRHFSDSIVSNMSKFHHHDAILYAISSKNIHTKTASQSTGHMYAKKSPTTSWCRVQFAYHVVWKSFIIHMKRNFMTMKKKSNWKIFPILIRKSCTHSH